MLLRQLSILKSLLLVCCAVALCGCRLTPGDKLEASLRQQEASIRSLEQQLTKAQQQLRDQENELQTLRQLGEESPFQVASSSRALESMAAWGAVKKLRIHPLASGVLRDETGQWSVSVIVQPVDVDGETLKVAGDLSIQVQQPGEEILLAGREFSSLQSRSLWSNGLVARGFQIELPVDAEASKGMQPGQEVLVTVTFKLGPEREFVGTQLLKTPAEP